MGQTKAQRVVKQLAGKVQKQTPIASDMFLPNPSVAAAGKLIDANFNSVNTHSICDTSDNILDILCNASFTGFCAPSADSTYDMGTNLLRWKVGYFDAITIGNMSINGATNSIFTTDGTINFFNNALTTAGSYTGINVTSGADPGHTHTGASVSLDHDELGNLNWAAAGHTIDADIDMNSNNLTEVDTIISPRADALIDLNAAEDIFHIKPGASAGNNYVIIKSDTDSACCPHIYPSVNGEGQLGDTGARWDKVYTDEITVTNNIVVGGTVDGVDIAARDHAESHTIASHSDTTGTGAELDDLTDNSMCDTLHRHSELSASDGTPDACLAVSATGVVTVSTDAPGVDTQYTAQVLYNTDATPPAASGFPVGTIYIQYTA